MKLCLSCKAHYSNLYTKCPICVIEPLKIDGYISYAPEFAHEGSGFKPNYFKELAGLEEANFWFSSRNQLILWALKQYCPNFRSLLEVGCGTGYVLSGISKVFNNSALHGSEIFIAGLAFASARLPCVDFMQMDARNIPFVDEFDVIGVFDVLEHIEEDERVLAQAHAALRPDGVLILTVPQHSWLWSSMDDYALHIRRYAASELHVKIERAGFEILRTTSFVSSLLPAMALSRLLQKKTSDMNFDATAELKIRPWLNSLFSEILSCELSLIRKGLSFPIGGSRLVVARKIVSGF